MVFLVEQWLTLTVKHESVPSRPPRMAHYQARRSLDLPATGCPYTCAQRASHACKFPLNFLSLKRTQMSYQDPLPSFFFGEALNIHNSLPHFQWRCSVCGFDSSGAVKCSWPVSAQEPSSSPFPGAAGDHLLWALLVSVLAHPPFFSVPCHFSVQCVLCGNHI